MPHCLQLALLLAAAAAQTLRVAYVGDLAFQKGWDIAGEKIANIGGFPVHGGSQTFGIATLEYVLDDSSSNPHLDQNVTSAVASAAAAGADVIVVGSSVINQRVMELGEQYSIPNIHCSGGNPVFWQSSQPHSFGMHVPFPWYSKGAISAGKVRGLRTLAVVRSFQWQFPKTSGLASLEWGRDSGYTVIGPTVQWCNMYAHLTGSCRIVSTSGGQRCVCAEQSEADLLGYNNLKIEEFPSLYELQDDKIVENDFGGLRAAKVSPNMASFVEGIIEDIRSQGADPDVIACWVENHRSVLYAASRKDFNPKMWVGVPNKAGAAWPGVEATMHGSGAQVLEATHALYTVTGMQWSAALRLQDPVFNTNAEYVAHFQAKYGRLPSYDEAACSSAGSVIYHALNKHTPSLDAANVALRREYLRLGIGDLNDNTLYGMTRFNRGGQNNGRGAVLVQFVPEGSGGVQRVVLPAESAERTLAVPMPTWDSKFGCSAGHFNTGTQCNVCQPGRFSANRTVGLSATVCDLCPRGVGTNASTQGATQCEVCAPGQVQKGRLHQGICHGCDAGTFRSASMPSTDCELCGSGNYSDQEGMQACDQCPIGSYQSDMGQTACICKRGWFRNPAATHSQPCLSCETVLPGATTRNSGSVSWRECACDRGFYLHAGECHSCEADFPKDSVVCNGFGAAPVLQKGWMTRTGESTVYLCPAEGNGCPGGVDVGVERCAEGGSDIACAWCAEGYRYSQSKGKCTKCGQVHNWLWAILVVFALGVCYALRPPTVHYTKKSLIVAIRNSFVSLTLSQIVDVLQLYSIYGSAAVEFTSDEKSMFSGIGGLFTFDTLSPLCGISGSRPEHALKVVLLLNLLPAFFILWLVVCSLPALIYRPLKKLRFPSAISACNLCLGTLVSFFTTVLNLAINLVTATYPHPKIDKSSLLAFPYLTDKAPEMTGLHVVSVFALAIWCVGTLALVSFMCWYLQTTRASILVRRCTVALVVRHRDGMSWWLVVEMIQKMLVAISVAIFERPDQQMQWIVTVFLFYSIILVYFRPYRFLRHTFFDMIFTASKFQMLVLAVTSVYNRGPSQSGILTLMVATLTICVLDFAWCLISFARGHATDPSYDRELLSKVITFFKLDLEPITVGEVVPNEDLPPELADLRNSRHASVPPQRAFFEQMTDSMGVERSMSHARSGAEQPASPEAAISSPDGTSAADQMVALQADLGVEDEQATEPAGKAGCEDADSLPTDEEAPGAPEVQKTVGRQTVQSL